MPTSIDPAPGEDEFECARCGAIFHYELTRCPNCGVNLYEPEDEDQHDSRSPIGTPRTGTGTNLVEGIKRLFHRKHPAEDLFSAALNQAQLYDDLLRLAGGDREVVERLIAYEREQDPGAGRAGWLISAIRRLRHDRSSN